MGRVYCYQREMTAPFPSQPRCSSPRFDREKPVAGYIRISGADGQTLEGQEAALREYCGSRGWKVQVYRDERSGADVSRPGLEAMLQAVRRGEVRAVVCVKLDRLGRSLVHLVMIVEELTRLGVPLICFTQGIDTSSDNPVGRLQLAVLMAIAEFERGLIRERTLEGLAAARARGSRLGRPPKITSDVREQIVRLRAEGKSVRAIGRELGLAASSVCSVTAPASGVEVLG